MSEALKALNNIRTLRAHARETDLATLEEMLENSLLSLKIVVRKKMPSVKNKKNVRLSWKPSVRNC
jgi:DNA-binding protein H-NS